MSSIIFCLSYLLYFSKTPLILILFTAFLFFFVIYIFLFLFKLNNFFKIKIFTKQLQIKTIYAYQYSDQCNTFSDLNRAYYADIDWFFSFKNLNRIIKIIVYTYCIFFITYILDAYIKEYSYYYYFTESIISFIIGSIKYLSFYYNFIIISAPAIILLLINITLYNQIIKELYLADKFKVYAYYALKIKARRILIFIYI